MEDMKKAVTVLEKYIANNQESMTYEEHFYMVHAIVALREKISNYYDSRFKISISSSETGESNNNKWKYCPYCGRELNNNDN